MILFSFGFLTCLSASFRPRYNLGIEILPLRQQLDVLKRKNPRPRLRIRDRIFWVLLRRLWPAWRNVLMKPTRTSPASPWQMELLNAGSEVAAELLDHVIVLNEVYLRRLIREYVSYYHADRIDEPVPSYPMTVAVV